MKMIGTLIAAGIALAALGGCQAGEEEEGAASEQEEGEQENDD